ncbi:MAG: heavy metal translocating P-type ATPase [Sulfurovum sp.]|nr:heavy metal translocating P-type ATPase [Sulfurovum sp.]
MTQVACSHCHLKFDESVMIIEHKSEILYFCCKGCEGVYHLLKDEGLDSFYEKLGKQTLNPPVTLKDDLNRFDLEGFKNKYIKITEDGLNQVSLIIEGIHCSACVWLNEKVLHRTDGIIEASINYSNNKAKIIWDDDEIKLSHIIAKIRSIGYNAYPYDPSLQEEQSIKERNEYYTRILLAVFASMNIMWLAIAQYAGYFTGIEKEHKNILSIGQFILATPTLFYSGWVFFRGAYYGLKNHFVNMDLLVASGALLAYAYSVYAMLTQRGEVYFDSVTMIITFVLVGKYLEVLSKKRASDTLDKIIGTMPTEATIIQGNEKELISVENITIGNIIELKPGEKVAVDGILEVGSASFDESSLTGENEPIHKKSGDDILSGTICLSSVVRYKVTKRANDSLLYTITELLDDSITKKPKIEQLANSISGHFSLSILAISLLTFGGWYWINGSFESALIIAISVIVIACPCALGLATPMATLIGISRAASRGILFKESRMLETMAKSTLLALDKTGTITEGKPSVISFQTEEGFDPAMLLALVHSSNHPVSQSIEKYLHDNYSDMTIIDLANIKSIDAKGVRAEYDGNVLAGGNEALMKSLGISTAVTSEHALYIFALSDKVVAKVELQDKIKDQAKQIIGELTNQGMKVVMLTGDHKQSACNIAKQVGIEEVHHSLLPVDKAKHIDKFHKDGEIVVMAGDGINDAIALAKSDIAIAMGRGADIAIEVSDIVLLDDKLESLLNTFTISKRTFAAIRQNLGFSLLYNIITIPLAVLGYVTPMLAALSMSLSSLVVVANSSRIKLKSNIKENR